MEERRGPMDSLLYIEDLRGATRESLMSDSLPTAGKGAEGRRAPAAAAEEEEYVGGNWSNSDPRGAVFSGS